MQRHGYRVGHPPSEVKISHYGYNGGVPSVSRRDAGRVKMHSQDTVVENAATMMNTWWMRGAMVLRLFVTSATWMFCIMKTALETTA